jgi:hypothetical protein
MLLRTSIVAIALGTALLGITAARAWDDAVYPDWSGQWRVIGGNRWDASKPRGLEQNPPFTPVYQKMFEDSLADQDAGGQGLNQRFTCLPAGMPRMMVAIFPFEFVVTPKVTYMLFEYAMPRRIFTDGRSFPKDAEPGLMGYSVGNWVDSDGDGRYDVLEVETRNFKGPRSLDQTGMPLHEDNQTIVKERLFRDAKDKNRFHDEVTVIDHAFTRPYTVTKSYTREDDGREWFENNCTESNNHVAIQGQNFFLSADGYLMPSKKGQEPPDLRYFPQALEAKK